MPLLPFSGGKPNLSGYVLTSDLPTVVPANETDPAFSAWLSATPPLYSETDPVFGASEAANVGVADVDLGTFDLTTTGIVQANKVRFYNESPLNEALLFNQYGTTTATITDASLNTIPFTFAFWYKQKTTGEAQLLQSNGSLYMWINDENGYAAPWIRTGGTQPYGQYTFGNGGYTGNGNDNNWHFCVAIITTTEQTLWMDGVSVSQQAFHAGFPAIGASSYTLGGTVGGSLNNCSMKQISMWNRVLSGTEIGQLYNGGRGIFNLPFTNGLLALYNCNEGSGSTLVDSSGNGLDMAGTDLGWMACTIAKNPVSVLVPSTFDFFQTDNDQLYLHNLNIASDINCNNNAIVNAYSVKSGVVYTGEVDFSVGHPMVDYRGLWQQGMNDYPVVDLQNWGIRMPDLAPGEFGIDLANGILYNDFSDYLPAGYKSISLDWTYLYLADSWQGRQVPVLSWQDDGTNQITITATIAGHNALKLIGPLAFDLTLVTQGAGPPASILTNGNLYVDTVSGLCYIN
jgi:hypothetical protein